MDLRLRQTTYNFDLIKKIKLERNCKISAKQKSENVL